MTANAMLPRAKTHPPGRGLGTKSELTAAAVGQMLSLLRPESGKPAQATTAYSSVAAVAGSGTERARLILDGLKALVGTRLGACRTTYGDELTLHFGELRPGRTVRLKELMFGTVMLGVRASDWVARNADGTKIMTMKSEAFALDGRPIPSGDVAREFPIPSKRGHAAEVVSAEASEVRFDNPLLSEKCGLMLTLGFSDGSQFCIVPRPDTKKDAARDKEKGLPLLADWELLTPEGCCSVGPGLHVEFRPAVSPARGSTPADFVLRRPPRPS